jgi:hypothetical protein
LEREAERQFAREAAAEPAHPTGWSAAVLLFHIRRWRERLREGLRQSRDGIAVPNPPQEIDALNARELREGAGISLAEAAAQSDSVVMELIDLWRLMGDRPFKWYVAETTGQALIRISYYHPRNHLAEHFIEGGDPARGDTIFAETAAELRKASAAPHTLGQALYNLARRRLAAGRDGEASSLLKEATSLRPDLRTTALADPNLAMLIKEP